MGSQDKSSLPPLEPLTSLSKGAVQATIVPKPEDELEELSEELADDAELNALWRLTLGNKEPNGE